MGRVIEMAKYRKAKPTLGNPHLRISEIERLMRQNRNTLYSSNDVRERERAAINNGTLQMELTRLKQGLDHGKV